MVLIFAKKVVDVKKFVLNEFVSKFVSTHVESFASGPISTLSTVTTSLTVLATIPGTSIEFTKGIKP